jgi:hypothetical protein
MAAQEKISEKTHKTPIFRPQNVVAAIMTASILAFGLRRSQKPDWRENRTGLHCHLAP